MIIFSPCFTDPRLQRLSVGEKSATTPTESNVNLAAGEDLLQMYQTQWATMHHMAEQNAKLAQVGVTGI